MIRLITALLAFGLLLSTSSLAASPDINDLEKRLQQQERRIDRLERTVESLQSHLMDAQYDTPSDDGQSRAQDRNAVDPLVGSWECTNNVFNYDITFFDDGRIIQEEPFFSTARNSRWTRMSDNRFVTDQGMSFEAVFHANGSLTVTNMSNQGVWECSRK
jgi:cell division protein FtsB